MVTLDRERIIDAAVALADRGGAAALSIRGLAADLGAGTMSIYHYVANKDELLDAMVDRVFAEIELPAAGQPWQAALHRRCASLRAALRRHPWAIGLMDSRARPGPATLRHHDAVVACLLADGFSVSEAAGAFALIDSYVYGFALQSANLPISASQDIPEVAAGIMDQDFPARYPALARLAEQVALRPGYDFEDEFEPGLAAVLGAIGNSRQLR